MEYFVQFLLMMTGLTAMYLVGVMDDLVGVSLKSKLSIEVLAATLIPLSGARIDHLDGLLGLYELEPWISFPLTIAAVVYVSNTISMLDDIDGLASGMAIIAFAVMAVFCGMANQYLLLMVCVAMVGLLGPFLFRNVLGWRVGWRKLFFGDTGGLTIGYILAYIVISVSRMGGDELPVGIGMACFGTLLIPMFDVMRVGITRLVNGRNVFRAGDRNHIHHRLIQAGLQPRQVLMVVLLITAEFIGLNIWGVLKGWNLSLLLVLDVTAWGLIQVVIMYYKNRGRKRLELFFDILIKAGADVDALKTAYSTAVPFLLSALLGWLFVPRVLLISRKRNCTIFLMPARCITVLSPGWVVLHSSQYLL